MKYFKPLVFSRCSIELYDTVNLILIQLIPYFPLNLAGSRRPSILPVPDMFTSSSLNISGVAQDEGDESEDELEDEVPWRSPSEKIA